MLRTTSTPPPTQPFERPGSKRLGPAFLILAAVLVAYAGSWDAPLEMDDFASITDNRTIRDLFDIRALLSPPAESGVGGRPLANFSFALSYALGRLEPWAYHLLNLAIHYSAALALLGVLRRAFQSPVLAPRYAPIARTLATAIALLWALHPLQTQTVTYLSQRTEALMGLCYLLTLYGSIRHMETPSRRWRTLAITACFMGTLAKEPIVTAPLLVLLLDRTFFASSIPLAWQRRRLLYCGLAASWLLLAWVMLDVNRRGVGTNFGVSPYVYGLTQLRSLFTYLQLALWPHPLIFDRDQSLIRSIVAAAPYAMLILPVAVIALAALRARRAWGFAAAAFFILLAPSSSILPVAGSPVAENRPYLALASVLALLVTGLHACVGLRGTRWICTLLAAAALTGTLRRNAEYSSDERIWRDTIVKAPLNPRAYNNLAVALSKYPERTAEVELNYHEALRLKPDFLEAHSGYAGFLLKQIGREAEALDHTRTALRLKPTYSEGHYNLAALLARLPGGSALALKHYQEAVRLNPDYADAHNNLGLMLGGMAGREPDALRHFESAIRLKPEDAPYLCNLALLLYRLPGREADALSRFQAALRLEPKNAQTHNDLALLLARLPNRHSEAEAHYATALKLRPNSAETYNNLGVLLMRLPGRDQDTLAAFNTALQLNPEYPEAHNNLGTLLASLPGREPEAIGHYETALRLTPASAAMRVNLAILLMRIPSQQAEAAALLRRALELDPSLGIARELLLRVPAEAR